MTSRQTDHSQLILKALTGMQSGVEVSLADGEYTLGSGQDDDLQFVDVSLKSGHARIRVEGNTIQVAGGAGTVVNEAGMVINAGDDAWRELAPLEIITIGANRFAIGPTDGNWAELSAALDTNRVASGNPARSERLGRLGGGRMKYGLAVGGALAGLLAVLWLSVSLFEGDRNLAMSAEPQDLASVREVFDRFPFGKSIDLRQEVDGTIYATGYVDEPVERRALNNAVVESGIPVNLRLSVLSSIRTQIAAAIKSFGVDVTFTLSQKGVASFEGEILDDELAERFFTYINTEVTGLLSVVSNVGTANSYFAEVKDLSELSGINDTVILQLQNRRIEASGVVVTDKLDAWVGFIQSYALRYADHIPLTSYVQLVNEQGQVIRESSPTRLGSASLPGESGLTVLDLDRLKQGSIGASDIFLDVAAGNPRDKAEGQDEAATQAAAAAPARTTPDSAPAAPGSTQPPAGGAGIDGAAGVAPAEPPVARIDLSEGARELLLAPSKQVASSADAGSVASGADSANPGTAGQAGSEGSIAAAGALEDDSATNAAPQAEAVPQDDVAGEVLRKWDDKADGAGTTLAADAPARQRYLPLVLNPAANSERCWEASRLRLSDIPTVLFWLDYLSLSRTVSLVSFSQDNQYLLLESALNPGRTRACALKFAQQQGVHFDKMSLYLDEAEQNPFFIRYLVRDFAAPSMDVAGVMLLERVRFIQMRDGSKVNEGSSPTVDSKVVSIGDLGSLLQQNNTVTPVIYTGGLTWKTSD